MFQGDGVGIVRADRTRSPWRRRRAALRRLAVRPVLEAVEARIAPVAGVSVWSGAQDNIVSNPNNWDVAPQPGFDLVFPAGAVRQTVANDLPAGTVFHSITIAGSGYQLVGNQMELTGGISATYSSGASTDAIDTQMDSGAVSVAAGGSLDLDGALTGAGGLTLSGGGQLTLSGASLNSYSGPTAVNSGTLVLNKDGVVAVPGPLTIGAGATVREDAGDQVADAAPVAVGDGATFDLNGNNDAVGPLALDGGASVTTGGGTLTLTTPTVTVNDPGTAHAATIFGRLALTQTTTFDVAPWSTASGPNLDVAAAVSGPAGAGVVKTGGGAMRLGAADSYGGPTSVNNGLLLLGDSGSLGAPNAPVSVAPGGEIGLEAGVVIASNPLALGGTLTGEAGASEWDGPVTLTGNAAVRADAGATLGVWGAIGDGGNGYGFAVNSDPSGTVRLVGDDSYGGAVDVQAGTLVAMSDHALSPASSGTNVWPGSTLAVHGGVHVATGPITISGTGVNGAGALEALLGNDFFNSNLVLSGDATIGVDPIAALFVSGVISDGGQGYQLTKAGNGTLVLLAANAYSGTTHVDAGALDVNGVVPGAVAVAAGGTLDGNGSVGVVTSTGGTVAAGDDGPGRLTMQGLTLDAASTLRARLDGSVPGPGPSAYDQIVSNGPVTLGGATLALTLGGGYVPGPGDVLSLVVNNSPMPTSGTFQGLPEGAYVPLAGPGNTFRVTYDGGTSGADVQLVHVQDTTTTVASSADPSVIGQPVTFTATVTAASGTPTGTVDFYDNGTLLASGVALVNGQASFSASGLALGDHAITVDYSGDLADAPGTGNLTQTVDQASTATTVVSSSGGASVYGQSVTLTATVSAAAPGSGTPTGAVDFYDGATLLGTASLANGQASLNVPALGVGSHSITAVYEGDADFAGGTSPVATETVGEASTSLTLVSTTGSPSVYGQPVTFTATLSVNTPSLAAVPGGTVDFLLNGQPVGTATLGIDGTASWATSTLGVGSNSLVASFADNGTFSGSSSPTITQDVSQASTTTAVTSDAGGPSVYGQTVTLTATVSASAPGAGTPTGTVDFYDGATLLATAGLVNGVATLPVALTAVGSHSITAVYGGDANFVASTSPAFDQEVSQDSADVSVTADINPSVYGQGVTFTVTVSPRSPGSGMPTGTVDLMMGATVVVSGVGLTNGTAAAWVSGMPVGTYPVTVRYSGDADFLSADSPGLTLTVDQANTSTSLSVSPGPSTYGQTVVLTATVTPSAPGSGMPTGTVDYYDGATLLGTASLANGVATLTTSSLAAGVHPNLTAVYSGDINFVASNMVASQTVDQGATSVSLASSNSASVVGEPVTLTADVSAVAPAGGTPTGSVDFYDGATWLGSAPLVNGQATLTISTLALGGHTLTAAYNGDPNFLTGGSGGVNQTVGQASTSTSVVSSASPSVVGQPVTLTATVSAAAPGSGTPTGAVDFYDGATLLGTASPVNGQATLTVGSLALGSHAISAQYLGDPDYLSSGSATTNQDVNQDAADASVVSSASPSVVGQPVTLTATVSAAAPGSGTPTGTVDFYDGATLLGSATLSSGQAALTLPFGLSVGAHAITTQYAGDANFLAATSPALSQVVSQAASAATVSGSSANPVVYGQLVTFTATVTAATPSPGLGTPTGTVDFYDGATLLGTVALDATGTATFTTGSALAAGGRAITAVYSGDANFLPVVSPLFVEGVNRAGSSVSVTWPSAPTVTGQPVGVDVTVSPVAPGAGTPSGFVQLLDNGVPIASAPLDPAGHAAFGVTGLGVGMHTLSVSYAGDGSFAPSASATAGQEVDADPASISLSASTPSAVSGQPVTFTAVVSATSPGSGTPSGTVMFFDGAIPLGTATLVNGTASLTAALPLGPHSVTAFYGGDGSFSAVATSDPAAVSVGQAQAAVSIAGSANPSPFGMPVLLTVNVTTAAPGAGVPTGTVTLFDGVTVLGTLPLVNGLAVLVTSGLTAGGHTITAVYGGDVGHQPSVSPVFVQAVDAAATAVALGTSSTPSVTGQAVTLTAAVMAVLPGADTPDGTVVFYDGSSPLGSAVLDGSGRASLSVPGLVPGVHSITAVYEGGANFLGSTSSAVTQAVNAAGTKTAVVNVPSPSVYGQTVTFTAAVAVAAPGAGTPGGSVTFYDADTPLGTVALDASGFATLTTAALGVGGHAITAVYAGNGSFQGSTSAAANQVVNQAETVDPLTVSVAAPVYGQPVTLTATFEAVAPGAGTPTGTVTFYDNGTPIGTAALSGGAASVTTAGLSVGSHAVTAAYAGDTNFVGVTSESVPLVVSPAATSTGVSAPVSASVSGQWVLFTAHVGVTAPGSATSTGAVTFFDGSTAVATVTPVNGVATWMATSLSVGTHAITASYAGSTTTAASASGAFVLSVAKDGVAMSLAGPSGGATFGQPYTVTATVTPKLPGAGAPGGIVVFYDNGAFAGSSWVVHGQATASLSLAPGGSTHTVTASYLGDAHFNAASSSVTTAVAPAPTFTALAAVPYRSSAGVLLGEWLLTAVTPVTPAAGTAIGTVTFLVNGSPTTTMTLSNGRAYTFVSAADFGKTYRVRYNGTVNLKPSTSAPVTLGAAVSAMSARPITAFSVKPRRG